MNIVVHNSHDDDGGGGYYSRPLIRALAHYGTVLESHPRPDLFVCIDHTQNVPAIGEKNLRVCYCPLTTRTVNYNDYNGAICLGDWIQHEQDRSWGLPSWVIYPSIDWDSFKILPKRKLILNVGGVFYDKGHSKNQHAVIKWFGDEELGNDGWELVIVGKPHANAQWYYDGMVQLAQRTRGVSVVGYMEHGEEFYRLFGEAMFLIHANGLTGHYPDEVEHFGIVAIEALASGCQPIVYNKGGMPYIPGVRVWHTWEDIKHLMEIPFVPERLRQKASMYSFDEMVRRAGKMLEDFGLQ